MLRCRFNCRLHGAPPRVAVSSECSQDTEILKSLIWKKSRNVSVHPTTFHCLGNHGRCEYWEVDIESNFVRSAIHHIPEIYFEGHGSMPCRPKRIVCLVPLSQREDLGGQTGQMILQGWGSEVWKAKLQRCVADALCTYAVTCPWNLPKALVITNWTRIGNSGETTIAQGEFKVTVSKHFTLALPSHNQVLHQVPVTPIQQRFSISVSSGSPQ